MVPVFAAPNEYAFHVARYATEMRGKHVADCAQFMEKDVYDCATMSGSCYIHKRLTTITRGEIFNL